MSIKAKPTAAATLLTPKDHALVLVDFQSQMAFATKSIDTVVLRNNAGLIASAAAGFKVPTVLTTAAEKTFSGPMFDEVMAPFPGQKYIDRTTMNLWEDPKVIDEIKPFGGVLLRTNLSHENEAKLREALESAKQPAAATPA